MVSNEMDGLSPEGGEDEISDYDEPQGAPAKKNRRSGGSGSSKGKGKATSSGPALPTQTARANSHEEEGAASQRKIQNRVAQREFRQRKLQYVKDLEARVEFLSSSKDEQLESLKAMLRGLLDENKQLRTLLQQVAGFVGKGMGGHSHELGFQNVDDWEEFVHRADRDTLHRIHEGWKTQYAKDNRVHGSGSAGGMQTSSGRPMSNSPSSSILADGPGQTSKSGDHQSDNSRAHNPSGGNSSKHNNVQNASARFTRSSPPSSVAGTGYPASAAKSSSSVGIAPDPSSSSSQTASTRKRAREGEASQSTESTGIFGISGSKGVPAKSSVPSRLSSRYAQESSTSMLFPTASFDFPAATPTPQSSSFAGGLSSSSFFFDSADAGPMPSDSIFAEDFLAAFRHTGLTPSADTLPWPASDTAQASTASVLGIPDTYSVSSTYGAPSHEPSPTSASRPAAASGYFSHVAAGNHLLQAVQLIAYHLRSKRADPTHVLPPSLEPTHLQKVTPHDYRIDGIIWPTLRDSIISSIDYDVNQVIADVLDAAEVHGPDNLLDFNTWELSEDFCQRYRPLVTDEVLQVSNRWRALRGEQPIQM